MSQVEPNWNFDPFAPGSNLKEDFDGTITSAAFQKGDNSTNFSATLTIAASDGDEVEGFYGVGGDWASYDGGKTIEHPKGRERKFNGQTAYADLITHAINAGAADILRERNRALQNRGPQSADIWKDLMFHFDVVKRPTRNRKVTKNAAGVEEVEWLDAEVDRMLPTKFLGIAGQGQGSMGQGTGPSTPAATTAAPSVTPGGNAPSSPPAAAGLKHPALATLHPADQLAVIQKARELDFGGFIDATMNLTQQGGASMLDNAEVTQALADEAFYNALRS